MNGRILLCAHELINGQRQADYGPPDQFFETCARMWGAYLGQRISGQDVCLLMALLKIARESAGSKTDNLLDAAGYIGLAADLAKGCYIGLERRNGA